MYSIIDIKENVFGMIIYLICDISVILVTIIKLNNIDKTQDRFKQFIKHIHIQLRN